MTRGLPRAEHETCFWYAASHVSRATISCRFRIGHVSELLPGVRVVIGPSLPRKVAESIRTVVCIRPFVDERMAGELARLRSLGVRLVADFDDLLFDGPAELFPSVLQKRFGAEHVAGRIGVYRRGLAEFDAFLASTPPLAEHLRTLRPGVPVHVVPNGLSRAWVHAGRLVSRRYREGDPRVIRYFAGSPTHDADLAHVAQAIARFLKRHPDVVLELAGMFETIPSCLPAERVRRLPMRPYVMLPQLVAGSWVSIAPLRPTPFSRCKSDIKFLEAGAFGVPTVASVSPAYDARHGEGLIACDGEQAFLDALESVCEPAIRADLAERAEAVVESEGYADRHLDAWLAATLPPSGENARERGGSVPPPSSGFRTRRPASRVRAAGDE